MKTSAKHFCLAIGPRPGNMSHNDPKTTSFITPLTKNPHPQPKKNFFEWRLANLFEPLIEQLSRNQRRNYGVSKATENCCFLGQNRSMNISYPGSQSVNLYQRLL